MLISHGVHLLTPETKTFRLWPLVLCYVITSLVARPWDRSPSSTSFRIQHVLLAFQHRDLQFCLGSGPALVQVKIQVGDAEKDFFTIKRTTF